MLPLCQELRDLRVFPDHHAYSADDVRSLERWVAEVGANLVLTTQKDLVKLRAGLLGPAPLRALRIGLELTAGGDVMDDVLARLLSTCNSGRAVRKGFLVSRKDLDHRVPAPSAHGREQGLATMKIAVFCPNLIGDTVMATPTFRALRAGFPGATIVGVIKPRVAPTLDGDPLV